VDRRVGFNDLEKRKIFYLGKKSNQHFSAVQPVAKPLYQVPNPISTPESFNNTIGFSGLRTES
jgi:hypothetical protein